MAYKERSTGLVPVSTLTPEVAFIDFTASTDGGAFTSVTLARVYDGTTAASATPFTYTDSDNPTTTAAAVLVAVEEALTTLISGYTAGDGVTVAVDGSTAARFNITFASAASGYDFTGTVEGDANISTTTFGITTAGSTLFTDSLPIGKSAEIQRLSLGTGWHDASLDVSVTDNGSTTGASVLVKTAIDASSTTVAYDKFLTYLGREGSDGATTGVTPLVADGPLLVNVTASAPSAIVTAPTFKVFAKTADPNMGLRKRHTGTITGDGATTVSDSLNLGATIARIARVKFTSADASPDSSVAVTIVDADSKTVYSETIDLTASNDFALGEDGVDQAGAAALNACRAVVKSPVVVSATSTLASGKTMVCTFWVEV